MGVAHWFALGAAVCALLPWLALVGAALYGLAVLVWAWGVLDRIRPGERPFAWPLFLALSAYACTGNVLVIPAGILPLLYLAVLRTPSARLVRHVVGAVPFPVRVADGISPMLS